jgi:dihydroneopterin aldolase
VTDAVTLRGIEFLGTHGATEEERLRKQRFSVDLRLELPLDVPAQTDQLADTADYAQIGERVIQIGTETRHYLLESLANNILEAIHESWPQAALTITVRKLQPPVAFPVQSIEVTLCRPARQKPE